MNTSAMRAFQFYWVVAFAGAIIMALEIVSARILAPHFGSSVYIWGSIISVFLAAMSGGYLLGGRLADRQPQLAVLGRLILAAALFQFFLLQTGDSLSQRLAAATGYSPMGTLVTASLLFGPPSLLLATVSPYAVRLAAREISGLGKTTGRLFAVSTIGSLAGSLLATFALIPYFELKHALALILLATTATAAVALLGSTRREALGWIMVLLLGAAGMVEMTQGFIPTKSILAETVTPHQTLRVIEENGIRYLRSDGVLQSAVKPSGESVLPYVRSMVLSLLWTPDLQRFLVLGMGAGTVSAELRKLAPAIETDYVEIDEAVAELATEHLFFEPSPTQRVHIADGRQFLARRPNESWDLIFIDTYIGLSVPFHLTTLEFFELASQRLTDRGTIVINLAVGLDFPFSLAVYRTMAEVFDHVAAFTAPGSTNILIFASNSAAFPTGHELAQRSAELDSRAEIQPSVTSLSLRRITSRLDLSEATLLYDAFAPANHLIRLGQGSSQAFLREKPLPTDEAAQ